MPRLIYGTAWKKERTADLVEKAVLLGFRGIDTACQPKHYSEDGVGAALVRLQKQGIGRDSLFLQTKFTPIDGQDPKRLPYDSSASLPTQVAQSFDVSLANLGTKYLDSLVLHSPLLEHSQLMSVWSEMENIFEQGGTKQLGISNCYDIKVLKQLFRDAKIKPSILQNRFYQKTNYDKTLRIFCDTNKIIYQSFWTLSANPNLLGNPILRALAKEFKKTEAQIFFRFLTQIGIVPLTGTCTEQHMKDDLAIFEFTLPDEILKKINKLLE